MSLKIKAILAALVIALVSGLVWWVRHDQQVITNQKITASKQADVIQDQQTTIVKQTESAKITDAATQAVANAPQVVKAQQQVITTQTEEQVTQIRQKYASSPQSTRVDDTPTPEEVEISQARITGVWKTYCLAVPSDAQCQALSSTTP